METIVRKPFYRTAERQMGQEDFVRMTPARIDFCLAKWSGVLFDPQVGPTDLSYFGNNVQVFRKMWREQGEAFWIKFVLSLRNVAMAEPGYSPFQFDWVFVDLLKRLSENNFEAVGDHMQNVTKIVGYDKTNFRFEQFVTNKNEDQKDATRTAIQAIYGHRIENLSKNQLQWHYSLTVRCAGALTKLAHVWKDASDTGLEVFWQPPKYWSSTSLSLPMEVFLHARFGDELPSILNCSREEIGWMSNPAYPAPSERSEPNKITSHANNKKPLCFKQNGKWKNVL